MFAHNELVTGAPGIRFYAGAPLTSPRGHALGALCLIDTVPRPEGLSENQQHALLDLAAMVISELELRSSNEILGVLQAELQRSNRDLDTFANTVSHDLQTPLRTISSFAALLQRQLVGRLSEDESRNFMFIVDGAKRMGALVSSLLQYAKLNNANVAFEEVLMEEVLTETIQNLQSVIQESRAEIVHQSLPIVKGQRVHLGQLFQNLLSNALKYRHPERSPIVEVSCTLEGNDGKFRVDDNGIGMTEQDCETIFEPLKRLHGDEIPGSGMGLAICRNIVERYGGKISVISRLGVGSSFCFSLPGTAENASARSRQNPTLSCALKG